MSNPSQPVLRFQALYDSDAQVWVATSDAQMTTEAATRDELLSRLSGLVPDVLSSRGCPTGPITIVVEWQELRTIDETTLAVA